MTPRSLQPVWRLTFLGTLGAMLASGCLAPGGPEDELGDEESEDDSSALSVAFQLPFPCGQVWSGQTRTNHSPQRSIDFNRPNDSGDKVVAAAAGKVTRVGNEGDDSYGRWIEIDHGDGYRTRYAHLSEQSVSVGQNVSRGQKIGEVGNTGGSTGAHLHYELRRDGVPQKPVFAGKTAYFYGTRSYESENCGGGGVTGTVNTNGADLTVRASPSTNAAEVGSVDDGDQVTISCQVKGSSVSGTYGTSDLWDYIGDGYIADAYVATGSDGQVAPTCD
jgi:hypothetical protein